MAHIFSLPASPWDEVAPLLDDAMAHLGEKDRAAILLRYFENKSLREVGAAIGTNEDAAQKRIARGLDKLREIFARRGVAISAASLASLVSTQAVQTAPAGSVDALCALAAGSAAVPTTTAFIMKGILNMLTWIHLRTVATAALMFLAACAGVTVLAQQREPKPAEVSQGDPIEALTTLAKALKNHDTNAFMRVVYAQTPKGLAFVSQTASLVDAQARFKQALAERFSEERAQAAMATINLTAFQFGQNNFDSADVTIDGDEATLRVPSTRNSSRIRLHKMVKKSGGWRLDVDSKVKSLSEPELAVFNNLNRPLEQSIKDVRAGKYVRIEVAVQTMKENVMTAARVDR